MPWDCHILNHETHQMLVPELDRVIFHLVNDLEERGLLFELRRLVSQLAVELTAELMPGFGVRDALRHTLDARRHALARNRARHEHHLSVDARNHPPSRGRLLDRQRHHLARCEHGQGP